MKEKARGWRERERKKSEMKDTIVLSVPAV